MKVTEVRLNKTNGEGNLKAFASVTFDESFVVHGLRIVDGKNGLFVAMPSRLVKESFKDVAHPLNKEFKEELDQAVFAAFNENQDK